jgi:hypothetical protein
MKATKRRKRARTARKRRTARGTAAPAGIVALAQEVRVHGETSPRLTGGDLDADWQGAYAVGDEAVGGSVATPDQSVVDEIGEALGLPQRSDAEVHVSSEILDERDRHRWALEGTRPRRRRP